jgi:hypothetical protein
MDAKEQGQCVEWRQWPTVTFIGLERRGGGRTKREKRPAVVENNFISYEAVTGEVESRRRHLGGEIEEGGLALRFCFSDSARGAVHGGSQNGGTSGVMAQCGHDPR